MKGTNVYIDDRAIVSEKAVIGDNTKVWINSQIRERARIGKNCIISKDTYVDFDVVIGDNVKIQNGVSVYHGVVIEDDVFIGPNATFTNDFYPRAFSEDWAVSDTLIKRGASVCANATIVCGNTIGEYAMIAAGSVVTHDVAPYSLGAGNPARQIGHVCKCGKKATAKKCPHCGYEIPVITEEIKWAE